MALKVQLDLTVQQCCTISFRADAMRSQGRADKERSQDKETHTHECTWP